MTQDEIIEMYLQVSKELCNDTEWCWAGVGEPLQMFAKLVAAKASAQRTEPPDWFPAVENILKEYGLQAMDFVADFKEAMKNAEQSQRTWVGLTDEEFDELDKEDLSLREFVQAIDDKLKEKNT